MIQSILGPTRVKSRGWWVEIICPKFAPTFIVGTVYVDLRVRAGRMVGRIRNINKKGQLSYVTVVS